MKSQIILLLLLLTNPIFSLARTTLSQTSLIPSNWTPLYHIHGDFVINFKIILEPSNVGLLENLLLDRSNPKSILYGEWLSKGQIDDLTFPYGVERFHHWLTYHNIDYELVSGVLLCSGKVDYINRMFQTNVITYQHIHTGKQINVGREYSVPNHMRRHISFVLGIGDFPSIRQNIRLRPTNDNDLYIAPSSIHSLYNITTSSVGGSTQAVAEFQHDACISLDDFHTFISDNDLHNSSFSYEDVYGKCNLTTAYPDVEATLDIQYQYGTNDVAHQQYVSVNDWLYNFAFDLYNMENPPLVNSMSWGWAEIQQCSPEVFPVCMVSTDPEVYVKRTNIEFMKLGLRGVTLLASSGDAGALSRINEGCTNTNPPLNPVFPTSSPWVTSVGGTVVLNATVMDGPDVTPLCKQYKCISGGVQLNCDLDRCGWTAGGGFSHFFNRPWWQENATNSYLNSSAKLPPSAYFNRMGRAYPDVSVVSHNFLIRLMGRYTSVDGTSASCPSFSGMVSRLNDLRSSLHQSSLGPIGPLLYQMAEECPRCFDDITEGSNNSTEEADCKYGYEATEGYDPVYGLGLPNFGYMYEYVRNL